MAAPAPSNSTASLYVGDLNPDVTEALLFEHFKVVGPILSIRVCRDSITRRSLCYAYVNFQDQKDAERCLETMNYTPVRNKPCRIMWSQRNPQLRKSNVGNIYIKNLDPSIDNKALFDTFSAFGNILSCKVPLNARGESVGYGFVHFDSAEAAKKAVEMVNSMQLKSRIVTVAPYHRPSLQQLKENFANVYVKNLKRTMDEDEVRTLFEQFGKIESMRLNLREGVSTGVAFIKFAEHEAAVKAIEKLHDTAEHTEGDPTKTLYVARHQTKRERAMIRAQNRRDKLLQLAKYVNLYVKNFDDTVDEKQLRETFEKFGKLVSVRVMRDRETNLTRAFGFVSFYEPEEAQKAIDELNNKAGVLGIKPLYVAKAQSKDERRAQILNLIAQRDAMFGGAPGQQQQPPQQQQQAPPQQQSQPAFSAATFYQQQQQQQQQMPVAYGAAAAPGGVGLYGSFPPQQAAAFAAAQQHQQYGFGLPQQQQQQQAQYGAGYNPLLAAQQSVAMAQPRWAQQQQQQQQQYALAAGRAMADAQRGGGMTPYSGYPPRAVAAPALARGPPMQPMRMVVPAAAAGVANRGGYYYPPRGAPADTRRAPAAAAAVAAAMPQLGTESTSPTAAEAAGASTAKLTSDELNQLGGQLFTQIEQLQPKMAAKITGMILEMDRHSILSLLQNPAQLRGKVDEAVTVLQSHPEEVAME